MLRTLISKITGISEERYEELKTENALLITQNETLQRQIQDIRNSRDMLQREALKVKNDKPLQSYMAGHARFVGQGEGGHSIYEIRVDGVDMAIRTKIEGER